MVKDCCAIQTLKKCVSRYQIAVVDTAWIINNIEDSWAFGIKTWTSLPGVLERLISMWEANKTTLNQLHTKKWVYWIFVSTFPLLMSIFRIAYNAEIEQVLNNTCSNVMNNTINLFFMKISSNSLICLSSCILAILLSLMDEIGKKNLILFTSLLSLTLNV